jgi:putative toxin-antitoxin system antitoxin component (TIGR02293 family)
MTVEASRIADILGGPKILRYDVSSLADLQKVVAEGLPIRSLDETAKYVSNGPRAAAALKDRLVPRATRSRRTRLKIGESEKVERIARLMALAEQVWENTIDARAFMNESHPMLEGRSPLEMAATELGARRVERLLMQLEYGLPA